MAKFGGTSLGGARRIRRCAEIVRRLAEKEKVVVVASAIAGVTDAILQAAYDALYSSADISPLIDLHHRVARQMGVDFSPLERIIARLQLLLRCVEILRVLPAAVLDEMLSVGERLSVRIVAAALRQQNLPAQPLDAHNAGFLTDDNHTAAKPLPQAIPRLAKSLKWDGTIKVLTGFIGRTREGRITTIGRNGSDLTAAIVAAALNAKELRIFTDTPGVLSADPRMVADAAPVRRLSYEEAAELARFGATVLHPQTIIPLIQQRIPVRVVSSAHPDDPGTLILPEAKGTRPVVASRGGLALLLFHSHRLGEVVTDVPRLFTAVSQRGWNIAAVANSRSTVGLILQPKQHEKGRNFSVRNGLVVFSDSGETLSALAEEMTDEFSESGHITVRRNVALICVVGYGVVSLLPRLQSALHQAAIPVLFEAVPGRDISVLFVVPQRRQRDAVLALHNVVYG